MAGLMLAALVESGSNPVGAAAKAPVTGQIVVSLATGDGGVGSAGLAIIDTSGRRVATLTRPGTGGGDFEPAWSSDGGRIAFARVADGDSSFQIYVMGADGRGQRRVGAAGRAIFDNDPAWSPDGRWIAYRSNGSLRLVHPDGSGDRQVPTLRPAEIDYPGWAPGGRIAYSFWPTVPQDWPAMCKQAAAGCGYVVTSRLDGTDRRRVVHGRDAHWSQDGRTIVFTGSDGGVYTVAASGGNARFLGRGYLASWSPDGSKIVYVRQGARPSDDSIWIMNRNGSSPHRLIVGASTPAWRP